ncbi:hypothetical protein BLNAU_3575 [Blattamonas nauphoetae]|uniref:Uncharacterized protein n=1 Tax=Blattamonas nauphoetae TaxID=2049346 RepID=A0ABQ9YCK0_9EUKA|nr:hypothetical protein BLNAU_3575 [Blattamonas nauphoetae]
MSSTLGKSTKTTKLATTKTTTKARTTSGEQAVSRSPIRPGQDVIPSVDGTGASTATMFRNVTPENIAAFKLNAENRLRQIMTMTPGESAKDKGTLFLELRDLCTLFHTEYTQSQTIIKNLEKRLDASQSDRKRLENVISEYKETLKQFEQFTYVPLNATPVTLEASIKDIEGDIKKFALAEDMSRATVEKARQQGEDNVAIRGSGVVTSTGTGRVRDTIDSVLSQAAKTSEEDVLLGREILTQQMHSQRLVEIKFKLLEDLVYVLKRRLNVFEQNVGLSEAVTRFGSVTEMLDENKRLEDELRRMKEMEARYDASSLLSHTQIDGLDRNCLISLVRALQNELINARTLVDSFDLHSNPHLAQSAEPLTFELFPFPTDDEEGPSKEKESEWDVLETTNLTQVTPDGTSSNASTSQKNNLQADIIARISLLENENQQLKKQIELLTTSLDACERAVGMDDELIAVLERKKKPVGGKGQTLCEVQKSNGELIDEIKKYQQEYLVKDTLVYYLSSLVNEMSAQNASLQRSNLIHTQSLVKALSINSGLKQSLQSSERRFRQTALLGIAFGERCLDLMGAQIHGNEVSDLMSSFVLAMTAKAKQSTTQEVEVRAGKKTSLLDTVNMLFAINRENEESNRVDLDAVDGVSDYLLPLCHLLSSIDTATDGLRRFPVLLRATKTFLAGTLHTSVETQLAEMQAKLDQSVATINAQMERLLLCQKETRAAQTDAKGHTRGAQTDINGEQLAGLIPAEGKVDDKNKAAPKKK